MSQKFQLFLRDDGQIGCELMVYNDFFVLQIGSGDTSIQIFAQRREQYAELLATVKERDVS